MYTYFFRSFAAAAGLIATAAIGFPAFSQSLERGRLTATFSEEFEDQKLNVHHAQAPGGRWKTNYDHGDQQGPSSRVLDSELQIYSDRYYNSINPFIVADGILTIRASPILLPNSSVNGNRAFSSGLITTSPSFSQRYGYFEMRARFPLGAGLWPAFWLLAAYDPKILTPQYPGEIDVVEFLGRDPETIYCSVHWPTRPDFSQRNSTTVAVRSSAATWRTYGVLWTEHALVWYVDDQEVARRSNPGLHRPMYLIANLAVGGHWGGPPNSHTVFPADFQIDFIKAYTFN